MLSIPARLFLLLLLCFGLSVARADDISLEQPHYVADIELQTADELRELLVRAEQLLVQGQVAAQDGSAVVFVLHGPVVRNLLRQNYLTNKDMVDLAASLSALGVVDIKACRTWMRGNRVDEAELQPFVETVPYGLGEVRKLVQERGYIYF